MLHDRISRIFSCALLVSFTATSSLFAADLSWNNTSGFSSWNLSGNWTPAGPAQAGDNAFFDQNANYGVIVAANAADAIDFSAGEVTLGGGTLNIAGTTSLNNAIVNTDLAGWINVGDALIGDLANATLTVNNGGNFESANLFVGDDAGSIGVLNVDGNLSTVSANALGVANGIFIGNSGTGSANVTDGGLLQTTDATGGADISLGLSSTGNGALNILGTGSRVLSEDFFVGEGGTGTLVVASGGHMEVGLGASPDVAVGLLTESSGNATITGAGSLWTGRIFTIGNRGDALVNIQDGGQLNASGNITLGNQVTSDGMDTFTSSGEVTVSGTAGGSDSLLSTTGILTVGNAGNGTLTVEDSGDVTVGVDFNVGNNASSAFDNTVTVTGAGSTITVTDTANIGLAGRAVLNISGGGKVISNGDLYLAENNGSNASATIDGVGSELQAADQLLVGNEGTGSLLATGGALVQAGRFGVADSDNDGSVSAANIGGTATISGSSGGTPTTLNVTGDEFFVGGSENENGGRGFLRVEAGALVTSDGLKIGTSDGDGTNGDGIVEVDGVGTLLDANANGNNLLIVGDTGAGALTVTGGAKIEASAARIGNILDNTTATMTIDGTTGSSRVEVDGAINIGQGRLGTLTISSGGVLRSAMNGSSNSSIGVGSDADGSTVTVDGAGSLWDNSGSGTRISVGVAGGDDVDGSRAALRVTNGGKVMTHNLLVADGNVTGAGELIIDGKDNTENPSTVTTTGFAVIGDDSIGRMTISNGGHFETIAGVAASEGTFDIGGTSNGAGFATITGKDSTLSVAKVFTVGRSSAGSLVIADGGTVTNMGDGQVGRDNGDSSTVIIGSTTADESTWNNETSLYFGGDEFGSGAPITAFIKSGGTINVANNTKIWSGTVNLNGGTLATDSLEIVQLGNFNFDTGTLRFTGNKTLESSVFIDVFGTSINPTLTDNQHLEVVGAASLPVTLQLNAPTASFSVGTVSDLSKLDWDAGTLNITGQNLTVGNTGLIGNSVVINQDQSLGVPNNTLEIDAGADLNVIRGGLNAENGTNNGLLIISNTDDVEFSGSNGLTNNGQLAIFSSTISGMVTNNGDIDIFGTANFLDDMTLSFGSTLDIDLNDPITFDSIVVAGDASLGGMLDIDVSGFSLGAGEAYEILDVAGNLTGTFAGLSDGGLVGNFGGVDLFIDYDGGDGNDVVLFTAASLTGDFDNDGDVDGVDFLALQRNDPSLISTWQSEYGGGAGSLGASTAVPEPTAVLLFFCGMGVAISNGRLHRSELQ